MLHSTLPNFVGYASLLSKYYNVKSYFPTRRERKNQTRRERNKSQCLLLPAAHRVWEKNDNIEKTVLTAVLRNGTLNCSVDYKVLEVNILHPNAY